MNSPQSLDKYKLLLQMEMHIKYQFQHATAKLERPSTWEFQRQSF
jgi:hypothetical protein